MPQQNKSPQSNTSGWEPVDDTSGWKPVDTAPSYDLSKLTANSVDPKTGKWYGLYKMVAPTTSGIHVYDIPYINVSDAYMAGFTLGLAGDAQRYAHDKFTELNGRGEKPNKNINYAGVQPVSAKGSKEWYKQIALKSAHFGVDSLPTIGTITGALAVGVPGAVAGPGDIAIAGAGAAAGAAGAEDLRQELNEKLFGEKEMTPKQAATGIIEQGALGFAQEYGGRYGAKLLEKPARYFGLAAEESAKTGIRLLPHEAAGVEPPFMERYARTSLFSSGQLNKFRALQNQETEAAANKLADAITTSKGTPTEIGEKIQQGIDAHTQSFRSVQKQMYDDIDKTVKEKEVLVPRTVQRKTGILGRNGKPIFTSTTVMDKKLVGPAMPSRTDIVAFAQKELDRINAAERAGGRATPSSFKGLLQDIVDNKDTNCAYGAMKDARSSWLELLRTRTEPLSGTQKGFIKKMAELADNAMTDAAKNSGIPGLLDKVRAANELTRTEHEKFEFGLMRKIAKSKEPSQISGFLSSKATGPRAAQALFEILPPNVAASTRRRVIEDFMSKANDPTKRFFSESDFAKSVYALGDEKGTAIFGQNWRNIKGIANVFIRITGESASASGAASLKNPGVIFELMNSAIGLTGIGSGLLGKVTPEQAFASIGTIGVQAAGIKTFAAALTHPATAEKMLKIAQGAVHWLPYLPVPIYNGIKDFDPQNADTERINKLVTKLREKSGTAPAAPGPQSYTHTAVNPATGHKIGSNDEGKTWYDYTTGQKVA